MITPVIIKKIRRVKMAVIEIIRLEHTAQSGTFGILRINKIIVGVTLERPWVENTVNISCIPAGQYVVERANSPTHGKALQVFDVPGRSAILFHPGNTIDDTHGCILVGRYVGSVYGRRGICDSRKTIEKLMNHIGQGERSILSITENY